MLLLVRVLLLLLLTAGSFAFAGERLTVRPVESDEVLVNPGIGFTTFHLPNGGVMNPENVGYPATSLDYLRVYWNFFEPHPGQYRWDVLDAALGAARARGQSLQFRVMPHGSPGQEVPEWYRAIVGPEPRRLEAGSRLRTDPENPQYLHYFGRLVRELGKRYDGHADLESIDAALVGAWGEGAGSAQLSQPTRERLVTSYLDSFKRTPLLMLLTDERTNGYAMSKAAVGWRADCLGDMGGFSPTWSHMRDYYPRAIRDFGVGDAWKRAPVSFEACWVMDHWLKQRWDVEYIIEQSLKWHISSFNAKSSPIPEAWRPAVNRWLKRMGYRLVLRQFTYPATVTQPGRLPFTSSWENKGVAPPYRKFPLALRLTRGTRTEILVTDADIRTWLPGTITYDAAVVLPGNLAAGKYELAMAILDLEAQTPKVKVAIAGIQGDGWYPLGKIEVR